MTATDTLTFNLLGDREQRLRLDGLTAQMRSAGISRALIRNNANIYWLTGRVARAYIYIDTALERPIYFVRRPSHLHSGHAGQLHMVRKPEDIPGILASLGIDVSAEVALELGSISYAEASRLAACFGGTPSADLTPMVRRARAVKTAVEQDMLRRSGVKQTLIYDRIPHFYREGMTDLEFQIEIERASRLEGCLGQFRVAGDDMELFMGSVLTGENADSPSPYDFAMGGQGMDPSIPVGADGTVIRPGSPVMVDVNGNYTGYMTDMTRMYICGEASDKVTAAHRLSCDICRALAEMMTPGRPAAELYARALDMATAAGMADYFMGHRSHAGFVGHGVGIEVNELPVIAPRSRDILEAGNVIALEPKFVIPGIGAVGIENTYIVRADGPGEQITNAHEEIMQLD